MKNWSKLPHEMLLTIVEHLKDPKDFIVCSGVCKSWRAVAKKENFKGLWQDTPYLMLLGREGNVDVREFYSLEEGRFVESVSVPKFKNCIHCLESLGWLLALGKDLSMSLLNPLTGTEIPLPPQTIIPPDETDEEDSNIVIHKMVLSTRPNDTSNYIMMVICGYDICGCDSALAFWRPEEQTWKKIESYGGDYQDVIYHDGRFYAVDRDGFVWAFDVVGNDVQEGRMITRLKCDVSMFPFTDNMLVCVSNMYILNVFESLLVITKTTRCHYLDSHLFAYNTIKFNVYKVDVSTGTWEETNSLGSKAVFIGKSATTALDASRYHGIIKPNHIYFTDDGSKSYVFHEEKGGGKDMGVYNLETETIEPFYSRERLLSITSPSLWITPHF